MSDFTKCYIYLGEVASKMGTGTNTALLRCIKQLMSAAWITKSSRLSTCLVLKHKSNLRHLFFMYFSADQRRPYI